MLRFSRLFYETIARKDNLAKYDVIVVGNIAAAQLARDFYRHTDELYSILMVNDKWSAQLHQGQHRRNVDPATIVDGTSISFTNGVGIKKINTDQNSVVLADDREVQYERLVIAQDLEDDFNAIKGLGEALQDYSHPVFTPIAHPKYRKSYQYIQKASAGHIFYYIPKFPFNSQEDFVTPLKLYQRLWSNNQSYKERLDFKYSIVTPNEKLFPLEVENKYLDLLDKHKIEVITGKSITSIDRSTRELTLNGNEKHEYDAVYLQGIDARKPEWLNQFKDFNPNTLQHNKFRNVFLLGAPTFNGFYTLNQVNSQQELVKVNLQRSFQGQKPIEKDTNQQTIFYYNGGFKLASAKTNKSNKVVELLSNNAASQNLRYVWQSQFSHRLSFLNDLQRQYITNRFYGAINQKGQKQAFQILDVDLKEEKIRQEVKKNQIDEEWIKQIMEEQKQLLAEQQKKQEPKVHKIETPPVKEAIPVQTQESLKTLQDQQSQETTKINHEVKVERKIKNIKEPKVEAKQEPVKQAKEAIKKQQSETQPEEGQKKRKKSPKRK